LAYKNSKSAALAKITRFYWLSWLAFSVDQTKDQTDRKTCGKAKLSAQAHVIIFPFLFPFLWAKGQAEIRLYDQGLLLLNT